MTRTARIRKSRKRKTGFYARKRRRDRQPARRSYASPLPQPLCERFVGLRRVVIGRDDRRQATGIPFQGLNISVQFLRLLGPQRIGRRNLLFITGGRGLRLLRPRRTGKAERQRDQQRHRPPNLRQHIISPVPGNASAIITKLRFDSTQRGLNLVTDCSCNTILTASSKRASQRTQKSHLSKTNIPMDSMWITLIRSKEKVTPGRVILPIISGLAKQSAIPLPSDTRLKIPRKVCRRARGLTRP